MKERIFRAVTREFTKELARLCPQFKKQSKTPTGSEIYVWKLGEEKHCFLLLQRERHDDCFYVEAGVSTSSKFPISILPGLPTDHPQNGDLRFRINRLWAPTNHDVGWWLGARKRFGDVFGSKNSDAELIENALIVVKTCVSFICDYVLPYFINYWSIVPLCRLDPSPR